ncbi:MAG: hypothetical protein AAF725_13905, partial [Acidobacteriota bacterium]
MSPRAIHSGRSPQAAAAWSLCLLVAVMASPALADDLFFTESEDLLVLNTEAGSIRRIGPTGLDIIGLTFLDRDTLLALSSSGSLYRLDPEDASIEAVLDDPPNGGGGTGRLEGGSLVSVSEGYVYSFKSRELDGPIETQLLNLESQEVEDLSPLGFADLPGASVSFPGGFDFFDGALFMAFPGSAELPRGLYTVSPATGALKLARPLSRLGFLLEAKFDSQGRLWVLEGFGIIAPPSLALQAIDFETGEPVPGVPSFPFDTRVQTFAF